MSKRMALISRAVPAVVMAVLGGGAVAAQYGAALWVILWLPLCFLLGLFVSTSDAFEGN